MGLSLGLIGLFFGLLGYCTHARFVRLPFHEPAVSSCNLALVLFVWAFMAPKRAKTKAMKGPKVAMKTRKPPKRKTAAGKKPGEQGQRRGRATKAVTMEPFSLSNFIRTLSLKLNVTLSFSPYPLHVATTNSGCLGLVGACFCGVCVIP